MHMFLVSFSVS